MAGPSTSFSGKPAGRGGFEQKKGGRRPLLGKCTTKSCTEAPQLMQVFPHPSATVTPRTPCPGWYFAQGTEICIPSIISGSTRRGLPRRHFRCRPALGLERLACMPSTPSTPRSQIRLSPTGPPEWASEHLLEACLLPQVVQSVLQQAHTGTSLPPEGQA